MEGRFDPESFAFNVPPTTKQESAQRGAG
jgi:hypothetical protein